MASEAVTRNDLTEILDKVLPSLSQNSGGIYSNTEVTQTGSTRKTVVSFNYTTITGKFLIFSSIVLKTSRYTSFATIRVDGADSGWSTGTNSTTPITLNPLSIIKNATPNSTHTIELAIGAQDSGTTATAPAYNPAWVYAVDLI